MMVIKCKVKVCGKLETLLKELSDFNKEMYRKLCIMEIYDIDSNLDLPIFKIGLEEIPDILVM